MTHIVLVDDEANILKSLTRALSKQQWKVSTFTSPTEALEQLSENTIDMVISDYRMPEMDGVEFLSLFRQKHPEAVRIILSGQADVDSVMAAINRAEVYRFITKPWDNYELLITLEKALEFNQLRLENEALANTVRKQSVQIETQLNELRRLERESPGITQVKWNDDGSISIEDLDFDGDLSSLP